MSTATLPTNTRVPEPADRHAATILRALRERPCSTGELADLTGLTPKHVSRAVSLLIDEGEPVLRGVPGSHAGALYMLTTAPYMPPRHCAMLACGTRLSPSNTGMYCRQHAPRVDLATFVIGALIRGLEADVGEAAPATLCDARVAS